jgi:hypothetical protein
MTAAHILDSMLRMATRLGVQPAHMLPYGTGDRPAASSHSSSAECMPTTTGKQHLLHNKGLRTLMYNVLQLRAHILGSLATNLNHGPECAATLKTSGRLALHVCVHAT